MPARGLVDLFLLGALWGASFLFMRVAAPEFGPIPLVAVRIAIGAACLLPFLGSDGFRELSGNWWHVGLLGLLNSALPFALISFAVLSLTAGFASIINASTPLWAGLIAFLWLGNRLGTGGWLGLGLGLAGVAVLVWDDVGTGLTGSPLAIPAAVLAAFSYGLAANYAKRFLSGVSLMALATGSLLAVALVLAPFAFLLWPEQPISFRSWLMVIIMGIASTSFANILYFRLIANHGPTFATTVAYLLPLFAMFFGWLLLGEAVSVRMIAGCGVILLGVALVTGAIRMPNLLARDRDHG